MGEHLTQGDVYLIAPCEMRSIDAKRTVQFDPAFIVKLHDQGQPSRNFGDGSQIVYMVLLYRLKAVVAVVAVRTEEEDFSL